MLAPGGVRGPETGLAGRREPGNQNGRGLGGGGRGRGRGVQRLLWLQNERGGYLLPARPVSEPLTPPPTAPPAPLPTPTHSFFFTIQNLTDSKLSGRTRPARFWLPGSQPSLSTPENCQSVSAPLVHLRATPADCRDGLEDAVSSRPAAAPAPSCQSRRQRRKPLNNHCQTGSAGSYIRRLSKLRGLGLEAGFLGFIVFCRDNRA